MIYAFKVSPAYTYKPAINKPIRGSKEWAEAEQSGMFTAALDHFQELAEQQKRVNGEEY